MTTYCNVISFGEKTTLLKLYFRWQEISKEKKAKFNDEKKIYFIRGKDEFKTINRFDRNIYV